MNIISTILDSNTGIESPRLRIIPANVSESTLIDLYEIYSDPLTVAGVCHPFADPKMFLEFMIEKIDGHQNDYNGCVVFTIQSKQTGRIIGLRTMILDGAYTKTGVRADNNENMVAEILINREYWGKGVAHESSSALFALLKHFGVKKVATFVNRNNRSAANLNLKLGFVECSSHDLIHSQGFHRDIELVGANKDGHITNMLKL